MKSNRILRAVNRISANTISLLNLLLPILLAEFIWFAASFIISAQVDPLAATASFCPMIEYLMTSLLITVGGAVVFDIAMLDQRQG